MKAPTKAQLARAGRRDRIVDAAREIAEEHGWPAVTARRLQQRWDSIINLRAVLQGVALLGFCLTLALAAA